MLHIIKPILFRLKDSIFLLALILGIGLSPIGTHASDITIQDLQRTPSQEHFFEPIYEETHETLTSRTKKTATHRYVGHLSEKAKLFWGILCSKDQQERYTPEFALAVLGYHSVSVTPNYSEKIEHALFIPSPGFKSKFIHDFYMNHAPPKALA